MMNGKWNGNWNDIGLSGFRARLYSFSTGETTVRNIE